MPRRSSRDSRLPRELAGAATPARPPSPVRPGAARGKRRLDNPQRAAQILALATQLFAERPYEDVAIDDLAQALGISKGLLYHYYPAKRDLYVAGLQQIADTLLTRTLPPQGVGSAATAPLARLLAGLDGYLGFVAERAAAFLSLMRGGIGADPQVASILDGCREAYLAELLKSLPPALASASKGDELAGAVLRLVLRGWIGFVESASIEWLARGGVAGPVSQPQLRDTLANALLALLPAAIGVS